MDATAPALDMQKMEAFLGRVVNDLGAALGSTIALMGDRLGLYRAMAFKGGMTPEQLAQETSLNERYVREWLLNQAAAGYVEYDPAAGTYTLPDEHAIPLTDENSPAYIAGGFQTTNALVYAEPKIREAFRSGGGMQWSEHHHDLFEGTERFFRPAYLGHLVNDWLPALDGVVAKLERGALVADVGCGHGVSTVTMAKAFPNSRFIGFDSHAPSIDRARKMAEEEGVADRVTFEVADATSFPGSNYDLIAFCDCFHDLANPSGAAAHSFSALAKDGTLMLIEPMAGENVQGNLNPLGRLLSGASVLCCTPNSVAGGGPGLGTVASDAAIGEHVRGAGFTTFRRATETPFNRVFEARR